MTCRIHMYGSDLPVVHFALTVTVAYMSCERLRLEG